MDRIWKRSASLAWLAGLACLLQVATPRLTEVKPGDIKGTTLDRTADNLAATWSKANHTILNRPDVPEATSRLLVSVLKQP